MHELTGFQRDLLIVTRSLDNPSGIDIKRNLEHSQGCSQLSSRVYRNLDDLVSMELLAKQRDDGRTNTYSVTSDGMAALRALYRWQEEHLPVETVLGEEQDPRSDEPPTAVSPSG
jgi:DNA-binding PadR family transcriptional regulator